LQLLDGQYVYSATDLNNYLECRHLVALSREVAEGRLHKPSVVDATAALIARKGTEHEEARLAAYVAEFGAGVVRFGRPPNTPAGLYAAEAATLAAMAAGAQIIYQATFFDGRFVGHADFLRRIERPCARWAWSYEVIDTKLALSPKPYFIIQLCNYSEHLERLQRTPPEHGYVVFGNGQERPFRIAAYGAYYRHLRDSFLQWTQTAQSAYPLEVPHCVTCVWSDDCEARREADDHLSLVAGIRGVQIGKLQDALVTTMTGLAEATGRPHRMSDATFVNLKTQAKLQVEQRRAIAAGETYPYRRLFREPEKPDEAPNATKDPNGALALKPPDPAGFGKLPRPAAGDLFFDIEGDPLYRADRGLEYLFGLYLPDENTYIPFWGKNPEEERLAFEACVDFIDARRKQYPDMHVYHYASYEKTALGRLMGTFASRENEVDWFFRAELFVDLFPIVRQALWISQPSYSLKKVEKFYHWRRETTTKGGDDSIVQFELWLTEQDPKILEDIRKYNEDDCRSTHALREWLVELRDEFNAGRAEQIPWRTQHPAPPEPEPDVRTELEETLLSGIPRPETLAELRALPEEVREGWLLGNLLQYHRRENKPAFWEYFDRCRHVEELAEFDRKAIGGLRRRWDIDPVKVGRANNLEYVFEYPQQEHDIGDKPECPDLQKAVTEIISHDETNRVITLKLSKEMAATLRALIPAKPLIHTSRQAGIERIAQALVDGTLRRDNPATSALLRCEPPRFSGRPLGATIQPGTIDGASIAGAIAALDRSYLFIQGPPGSGKSTTGADAIVARMIAGERIGLMANSHKALHGLLHKIEAAAQAARFRFDGVHKMSQTDDSEFVSRLPAPMVRSEEKVPTLDARLHSGTAYFWATAQPEDLFDTMIIDEAGQVSLADALNASMAARNVVLLGDPQQLPMVTQGTHPAGTARSVLQHLLGDAETVPPDRGIFLGTSFRMQPDIATFVSETSYEGRLHADARTLGNRVASSGLRGGGLVHLAVHHEGNERYSLEEADRIVAEVRALLHDGTFVRFENPLERIEQRHVVVVTPYNLQRRKIEDALVAAGFVDVQVGTVDKFQGLEAPVVFYSMATSSGDDLPRDMTFLFDRNRFNVAVSRAQCLSVLVCSPRLLDARCRNAEQMELANLLCSFVERAVRLEAPAPILA
jgi:predicted RecB family nuclease